MPKTTTDHVYAEERALLLARLVLSRRKDVQIITFESPGDAGLDLLIRVPKPGVKLSVGGGPKSTTEVSVLAEMGIQVKAASEPLEDEEAATEYANRDWEDTPSKALHLFPVILMLFSVEDDRGYFSWLMEPSPEDKPGALLSRVSTLDMKRITRDSIDAAINRSLAWYDSMVRLVLTARVK